MPHPVPAPGDPTVNEALGVALGLTGREYRLIEKALHRTPTYTELGMYSVMWSEHCSYKHSRKILRMYPTKGPTVLQGPGENAGGVRVAPDCAVLLKIESHNHPSMVEPYQGAATGVGGILRDIFTMGARPIALLDSLRFGNPTDAATRRVVRGVVAGIGGYGNCIGIPTVGGEVEFAPSYRYNCLVNAMAVGTIDPANLTRSAASGEGNLVVYMGAATGRDGIHGASLLASQGFGGAEKKKRDHGGGISAVQVADPFLGKLLMEASIDLCRAHVLVGMQDMGAAGLTCSTIEMSAKGGWGMEVDLNRVPQRAEGMSAYEIMLSESQERMLFVVEPRKWPAVRRIVGKYRIPLSVIGRVRRGGRVRIRHHGRFIVDLPARSLADDAPLLPLPRPVRLSVPPAPRIPRRASRQRDLLDLLGWPSLACKRPVWRQYDHTVRTGGAVLPGADAAVLRLKGRETLIALSVDGPGRLTAADPFRGGQLAIAEAARNVACAGARPVAFTNGLNFPNPDRPGNLWRLREAVRGIALGARKLKTPVVSGNVSLYNEHEARGIDPTPMIGMLGVLDGWSPTLSWFHRDGDAILLLGHPAGSLSASAYQARFAGGFGGRPVAIRWDRELAVQRLLVEGARQGLLASAHDLSEGGLLVALAECCAAGTDADRGRIGCSVGLSSAGPADLFGEAPSRVLVTVADRHRAAFDALVQGVPCRELGRVGGDRLVATAGAKTVVDLPVAALAAARERPLAKLFG